MNSKKANEDSVPERRGGVLGWDETTNGTNTERARSLHREGIV
ncbi:MAG: hypothetical protein ACXVIV_07485 [Halobacteriota archaeon]